jgi:archaemetzincin
MAGKALQLVPIGTPPLAILRSLEEPLLAQLGMTVVHSKTQLQTPTYAFNKDRNQYHTGAIMRRLATLLDGSQPLVMGVLDVDIFVPDAPFVFGEADRQARVAVVSIARLRQGADPETAKRRIQIEAVQEAGHLLGLSFCDDSRCVMFLAQSVADCDRKGITLCSVCRNELAKLNR